AGKLQAGNLELHAAQIDNLASGEISGIRTRLHADGLLANRGLIDGVDTRIDAAELHNLGTGRIYGDHLSIGADTVLNGEETVDGATAAATIAARQRLDIGADTLINREQ